MADPSIVADLNWAGSGRAFEASSAGAQLTLASGHENGAMSPMQALLVAAAACMGVDVLEILEKSRQPAAAYVIHCEGWRADQHPRRFVRILLTHHVSGAADEAIVRRAVELSQTRYCSAMASLDPEMSIENRIVMAGKES